MSVDICHVFLSRYESVHHLVVHSLKARLYTGAFPPIPALLHSKIVLFKKFFILKFIYSKKATEFCEIFTLLMSYGVPVKSKMQFSQNFVAFSDYMNFT